MGDRSKLPRSLVRLRRRVAEERRKNQELRPEGPKQTLLSIEVAELLLAHGWTPPPPPRLPLSLPSFLCARLTRALKEQQQLFNLKRYCPTEGFAGKRPSSMLSSLSQPVSTSHSIFQSKLGMPPEQLLSPKPLFCDTCKIRKQQNSPVREKSEKPITLNKVSCVGIRVFFVCCFFLRQARSAEKPEQAASLLGHRTNGSLHSLNHGQVPRLLIWDLGLK